MFNFKFQILNFKSILNDSILNFKTSFFLALSFANDRARHCEEWNDVAISWDCFGLPPSQWRWICCFKI